ncbi:hypothetical protein LEP1GSC176_3840 [Leptospira kirschneri str. MMD1493]|nr:hypothetical protein LEP1GSC176_3840 [Leptospira kirschneri str. MMD1493]
MPPFLENDPSFNESPDRYEEEFKKVEQFYTILKITLESSHFTDRIYTDTR